MNNQPKKKHKLFLLCSCVWVWVCVCYWFSVYFCFFFFFSFLCFFSLRFSVSLLFLLYYYMSSDRVVRLSFHFIGMVKAEEPQFCTAQIQQHKLIYTHQHTVAFHFYDTLYSRIVLMFVRAIQYADDIQTERAVFIPHIIISQETVYNQNWFGLFTSPLIETSLFFLFLHRSTFVKDSEVFFNTTEKKHHSTLSKFFVFN